MKKLIILISIFGIFSSCDISHDSEVAIDTTKNPYIIISTANYDEKLKIVEIESCQYFIGNYDRSLIFEHKGNCKNKIHSK